MNILLKNALLSDGSIGCAATTGKRIAYIGAEAGLTADTRFDEVIDCGRSLLLPGLYNCHTHAAMTLFRGYGEDLPLQSWLNDRIFPAEDRLTDEAVYVASLWAIAEMLRGGIVSFSDMYMFCPQTARAALETGIKANISRSLVSFDPDADFRTDFRFLESKSLFEAYNGADDGRILIDMSLHAEYTNVGRAVEFLSDYAAQVKTGMHVHLSETEREHAECIARHGVTPARFFADRGAFDVPATAAHCVWVSAEDRALLAEKGVSAAHNPTSNLKLGSGVMPLPAMLRAGVNVTLGTDGAASNNTLDLFKEMHLAAILHKGVEHDTTNTPAAEILRMATANGAIAQHRPDCGRLEAGCRADLILVDMDSINNIPSYDPIYTAIYSARSTDVRLTMADGKILYRDGEFTTIDFEKLKQDMRDVCARYFQ